MELQRQKDSVETHYFLSEPIQSKSWSNSLTSVVPSMSFMSLKSSSEEARSDCSGLSGTTYLQCSSKLQKWGDPISGGSCTTHAFEVVNHPTSETLNDTVTELADRKSVV